MAGYNGMTLAADSTYLGHYHETSGLAGVAERLGLIRADSMDVVNDPRFFNDNVLNYRLAAFSGLGVVSGLMTQNCMGQIFGMSKVMPIFNSSQTALSYNGITQLVCFIMLLAVLMANMLATYIGVAQPYHTMRLMTAGPTGFDAAASYYLNRNIVSWRHLAIKSMLQTLPLYLLQMGLRLTVKFDRATEASLPLPKVTPMHSLVQGLCFCAIMQCLALMLLYVHSKHFSIFRERYDVMTELTKPMSMFLHQQMVPRSYAAASGNPNRLGFLDV